MPTVAESKTLKNSHGGVSSFVLTCIWHLPDRKTAVKVRTMVQNRWAEKGFVRGSVKEEVTGGYGGRTLINRLEAMMDKRRKTLEDIVIQRGTEAPKSSEWQRNRGRYEGIAACIAILRSSSVDNEIERSDDRLGINQSE